MLKSNSPTLNVRWPAVFFGWMIDFCLTLLIQIVTFWAGQVSFYTTPTINRPAHLLILALLICATGVGGFFAARIAAEAYLLNGLMVGVVGILINTALGMVSPETSAIPPLFIVGQLLGCLLGVLGGLLARLTTSR